jgi:hypothetical protein
LKTNTVTDASACNFRTFTGVRKKTQQHSPSTSLALAASSKPGVIRAVTY